MSGNDNCVNRNRERQVNRRRRDNRSPAPAMDMGRELCGDVCDRQTLAGNRSRNRDRDCQRRPTTS